MAKKDRKKRFEAEEIILNCIKDNHKSVEEIKSKTGLSKSTIYAVLERKVKSNDVDVVEVESSKKGWPAVKKYKSLNINLINSDYLSMIMDTYEAAIHRNSSIVPLLKKEMLVSCLFTKIHDENFIRFIIDNLRKKTPVDTEFLSMLSFLTIKLREEINLNDKQHDTEKDLLKLIADSTDFVIDIITDEALSVNERMMSFMLFSEINPQRTIDVAFTLLKTLDNRKVLPEFKNDKNAQHLTEFEFFRSPLRQAILCYANQNFNDFRSKLYTELEGNSLSKLARNELMDIWAFTNPGAIKGRHLLDSQLPAISY